MNDFDVQKQHSEITLIAEALYLPSTAWLATSCIIREPLTTINDALLYVTKIIHRMAFIQNIIWVPLERSQCFLSGGAYSAVRN